MAEEYKGTFFEESTSNGLVPLKCQRVVKRMLLKSKLREIMERGSA